MANALDLILSSIKRKLRYRTGDAGEAWDSLLESLQNPVPLGTSSQLERGAQLRMQPGSLRPNLTREQMVQEGLNIVGMAPMGTFVGATPDAIENYLKIRQSGADPRKIWSETGVWEAPGGHLVQEVSDHDLVFIPSLAKSGKTTPLADVLDHDPLYAAVPQARNVDFIRSAKLRKGTAEHRPDLNRITTSQNPTARDIIHEVQHVAEDAHGFPSGGSPSMSFLREMVDPNESYMLMPGEAMARATERLINLDDAGRRATFPADSYDVPINRLTDYANDGASMMALSRPTNAQGQPIPPTRYELAHAEAQRVAALPVKQGGLGLPEGNTAMDRARAMGFEGDYYNGGYGIKDGQNLFITTDPISAGNYTGISDNAELITLKFAQEAENTKAYASSKSIIENEERIKKIQNRIEQIKNSDIPDGALVYNNPYSKRTTYGISGSNKSFNSMDDVKNELIKSEIGRIPPNTSATNARTLTQKIVDAENQPNNYINGAVVHPLYTNAKVAEATAKENNMLMNGNSLFRISDSAIESRLASGVQGLGFSNDITQFQRPHDTTFIFDPTRIRSRFAAFNPQKRDSADLLAGLGLPVASASALAALIYGQDDAQASELQRMAR
jgi:hypothetical protein